MAYIRGSQVRPELGAANFGAILAGGQQQAAYIQQGMSALGQGLAQGIQGYNQKKQEKKLTDEAVKFIVDSKMFGEVSPEQARAGVNAIGAQQFMSVLSSMEKQAQSLATEQARNRQNLAIAEVVNRHTDEDGQVNVAAVNQDLLELNIAGEDVTKQVKTMTDGRVSDLAGKRTKKQQEEQFRETASLVDQNTGEDGRVDMVALRRDMLAAGLTSPELTKYADQLSINKKQPAPVLTAAELGNARLLIANGNVVSVRYDDEEESLILDSEGWEKLQKDYPADKWGYNAKPLRDGTFKLTSMYPRSPNDPFAQLLAALLPSGAGGAGTDQPNSTGTGTSKRIPPPVITNR